jgi:hypothetical protein
MKIPAVSPTVVFFQLFFILLRMLNYAGKHIALKRQYEMFAGSFFYLITKLFF